ncbi:DUF4384 domain-containing protein [Stigmatella erecta]|uniref:DUF4384 domain-containing protein n=1 Tax=Stigmatella erecta TaxID=83460 RepID=A0A1H9Z6D6_9BACT|nr:DUF4384 domain-containing protein [Stigmatella erecta]SES77075.1 protein of unknown function [Stigmatella erecta]
MNRFDTLRAFREAGHPPGRVLDELAFASGEMPRASGPARHVSACEVCQARIAALREERARFLRARPARAFSARVLEQAARPSWWERPRLWALAMVPALALVALALQGALLPAGPTSIRYKGAAPVRWEVLVSREGQPAVAFPEGVPLRQGDVLRFRVVLPERGYVFIANLDEAGQFTRYYPADSAHAVALEPGEHVLPGSVVLDDVRGEERVLVFLSPAPLESQEVEAALRQAFERAGGLRFEDPGLLVPSASHVHVKEGR